MNKCFLVLSVPDCEPLFGRVLDILQLNSSELFLFVSVYTTTSYDSHLLYFSINNIQIFPGTSYHSQLYKRLEFLQSVQTLYKQALHIIFAKVYYSG